MWPPRRDHFWPQGYNWNKLGRGPLDDIYYIPNIKALDLVVSDKIFYVAPYK